MISRRRTHTTRPSSGHRDFERQADPADPARSSALPVPSALPAARAAHGLPAPFPAPHRGSAHGPADPPGRRWWRLRTIRARLALIVAVPTVLLMVLTGAGVVGQLRVTAEATAVSDNVELVLATEDLINSLQRERALTSGFLGGAASYRPQMDAQRRASDQNRAALDRLASGSDTASGRAVRGALQRLSALESLRGSIDSARLDRTTVLDFYTNAITALSSAADDDSIGREDEALRRSLESLSALGTAKEAIALERGQLNGVFAVGRFTPDDYRRFTETRAVKLEALLRFRQQASARRMAAVEAAMRTPQANLAGSYELRALAGAGGARLGLSPPRWSAVMTTVGYDLRQIQRGIGDDIRVRAQEVQSDALRMLTLYGAAALAMLVIALLLWLYTFRSIVRPLRSLTDEAHEAAERRLPGAVARVRATENPDDIVLESSRSTLSRREDEFAEVATALDNLQETAVRLAVEQAVMRHNTAESLANLGRRNQNLVRRQLGFISALEREESDPNALANLFELDHLATRMRRNAESLLVLVGEHSPRRWSGAVAVGDVMRSAFAEVEDYRRVSLRRAEPAAVQGVAAAEISHLLAELVDNALSFSPPDQEVEVQARSSGNEYHIAIVDQGVGMSPEAMEVANARLSGKENFLVSPTRDLGHYVVGRLAQRLGIKVWLHDSPLNGVTARVVLPAGVLVKPERKAARPMAMAAAHQSAPRQVTEAGAGGEPLPAADTGPAGATRLLGAAPVADGGGSTAGSVTGTGPLAVPPPEPGAASATGPIPVGATSEVAFGSTQPPQPAEPRREPSWEPAREPAREPGHESSWELGHEPPPGGPGHEPHRDPRVEPPRKPLEEALREPFPHGFQGPGPERGSGRTAEPATDWLSAPVGGGSPPAPGDNWSGEGTWAGEATRAGEVTEHPATAPPTTRNGLVKRTPQSRTLRRPIRPADNGAPAVEEQTRTPSDVRSMLNSFRAGVQRGEQDSSAAEPPRSSH